mgnify:CR=1 FL=1
MIEEFSEYCIFSFLILSTCALAGYFRVSISFTSLYFTKSFDIDKLYVARFSYNKDGVKINHDIANSTEQVANAIKNEMLDAYMKVLLTKDNTNSLKLSIDNATENTKDVLKDIESNREVHHV